MKRNKWVGRLRLGILLAIFILVSYETYMHQVLGAGKSPSVHALCPFGGLESLYQVFTTGSFVSKIFTGTMILFGITVVLTLLFRRSFCGLLCPFGAIQEYIGMLGQRIFRKKYTVHTQIDKPLRYLKYIILLVTVFYAWKTAGLWMNPYDPWAAFNHMPEGLTSVWDGYTVGFILLIVTMLGSLIYDRFFCKYLCPMGALYGIIGKLSRFKVVRNEELCIDCGKCNKVCPVNIDVQHSSKVTSAECINCQSCIISCPKAGALESKQGKLSLKPVLVIVMVLVLFFGAIGSFQAAGVFNILPEQVAAGESISFSEVKGFMSIQEAAEDTNTELKEFYHKFAIPEDVPPETKMKDISKIAPDYRFDQVKESFGIE